MGEPARAQQEDAPPDRPYRISELVLSPEGERRIESQVGNLNPAGRTIDKIIEDGNVVTTREVEGWLVKLGAFPTTDDVEEVRRVLNIIRATKPRPEVAPDPPQLLRARESLKGLAADIPALIAMQNHELQRVPSSAVRYLLHQEPDHPLLDVLERHAGVAARLAALRDAVADLQADAWFADKGRRPTHDPYWFNDLDWIVVVLRQVGARAGRLPGKDFGFTNRAGVGPEVLEEMLARVGIVRSRDTIVDAVKDRARKPRRAFSPARSER